MTNRLATLKATMDKAELAAQRDRSDRAAEKAAWAAFVAFRDAGGFQALLEDAGPGHWRTGR